MLNKRGAGFTDLFVFMIYAFILIIICVVFIYIGVTTEDKLLEEAPTLQKQMNESVTNMTKIIQETMGPLNEAYNSLKWITTMLIIGMIIAIIVSSYLITIKSPVYFIPYFIIVIIATIVAAPLSNTYDILRTNPTFADSFSGFYGANFIFSHLPTWIVIIGFMAGIIMYVGMKKYKEGDY